MLFQLSPFMENKPFCRQQLLSHKPCFLLSILMFSETTSSFLTELEASPGQGLCYTPLSYPLCYPEKYLTRSKCSIFIHVTSGSTVRKGVGLCTDGVFSYSPFGQAYCFVDFFPFSPKILGHP